MHSLGMIDVLPKLFGEVIVPRAVAGELSQPAGVFEPIDISRFTGFREKYPTDMALVATLRDVLDAGESEAIALCEEIRTTGNETTLLIDEALGREVAQGRGISVLGVAGILILAKKDGHVPLVIPLLMRLQQMHRFHLSAQVMERVRKMVGE